MFSKNNNRPFLPCHSNDTRANVLFLLRQILWRDEWKWKKNKNNQTIKSNIRTISNMTTLLRVDCLCFCLFYRMFIALGCCFNWYDVHSFIYSVFIKFYDSQRSYTHDRTEDIRIRTLQHKNTMLGNECCFDLKEFRNSKPNEREHWSK